MNSGSTNSLWRCSEPDERKSEPLQTYLRGQCRGVVKVEPHPVNGWVLTTHSVFSDGDRYPIHLKVVEDSGFRLTDHGYTLMRVRYEEGNDAFWEGQRGMLLDGIMKEAGLQWDDGSFFLSTTIWDLPKAVTAFMQALRQIDKLRRLPAGASM